MEGIQLKAATGRHIVLLNCSSSDQLLEASLEAKSDRLQKCFTSYGDVQWVSHHAWRLYVHWKHITQTAIYVRMCFRCQQGRESPHRRYTQLGVVIDVLQCLKGCRFSQHYHVVSFPL